MLQKFIGKIFIKILLQNTLEYAVTSAENNHHIFKKNIKPKKVLYIKIHYYLSKKLFICFYFLLKLNEKI